MFRSIRNVRSLKQNQQYKKKKNRETYLSEDISINNVDIALIKRCNSTKQEGWNSFSEIRMKCQTLTDNGMTMTIHVNFIYDCLLIFILLFLFLPFFFSDLNPYAAWTYNKWNSSEHSLSH